MLKKLAVAGALAAAVGGAGFAAPAQAQPWDGLDGGGATNLQILPIQLCDAEIAQILAFRTHNGPCTNGAIQATR